MSIRSLVIRSNNFSGLLPSELRRLLSLQQLDVSSNKFFGSVQLGNLSSLQKLNISHNSYAAELPLELGNLFSLQQLDISHNNYSGWLPPHLGNLSSLQQLVISYNYFANYLPPELGKLASLQQLDISHNNFAHWLPPELGNLSSLQQLDISFNNFIGSLPPQLGNLESLQQLNISYNNFNNSLPLELEKLASLQLLVPAYMANNIYEIQQQSQSMVEKELLMRSGNGHAKIDVTVQNNIVESNGEHPDCVTCDAADIKRGESTSSSYIHPFISKKLMQMQKCGILQQKSRSPVCHGQKEKGMFSMKATCPASICCIHPPWNSTCTDLKCTSDAAMAGQKEKLFMDVSRVLEEASSWEESVRHLLCSMGQMTEFEDALRASESIFSQLLSPGCQGCIIDG